MASSAQDQVDQLKSLIVDLEERRQNLRLFDGSEEINSHCDDLIGQVTLTVESAMDHLNKVQDRLINEINEYRRQLLDAQYLSKARADEAQSTSQKGLMNLSNEIEIVKSDKLPHDQALDLAKSLLDKANELRRQLRAQVFGGEFLRFLESDCQASDIIGRLEKTKKDVQDDFAIKHFVLEEMVPSTHVIESRFISIGPLSPLVTAIKFLRDGTLAVVINRNMLASSETFFVWDPNSNKVLSTFVSKTAGREFVSALEQLPDGRLVVGCHFGSITIWDFETQEWIVDIAKTGDPVLWLKALPNGKLIAFGRDIRVWNRITSSSTISTPDIVFKAHGELDWFERRREIDAYNKMKRYSRSNPSKVITLGDYPDPSVQLRVHLELLSDGHLAFSYVLPDGPTVIVWDHNTGKVVKKVNFKAKDAESCTILPNGDVVIWHADNKIEIYNLDDQKFLQSFRNDKGPIVAIRIQAIHSLTFVHLKDSELQILANANQTSPSFLRLRFSETGCFSNDGKQLAIGGDHQTLVMWPIQN